jgi:hypothetical protein
MLRVFPAVCVRFDVRLRALTKGHRASGFRNRAYLFNSSFCDWIAAAANTLAGKISRVPCIRKRHIKR